MKQLLQDVILFEASREQINESIKNNSSLIVSGILQRAETRNQNGRVYPKNILEREVEKYKSKIQDNVATGELDHPDSSTINLKNVSHKINNVYWEGDDVMGEVEILTTPSGNILKELLKSGVKLGISSRGMGSVKQVKEDSGETSNVVQDDFEMICWDFVSNPSTHGAYMKPLKEGVEIIDEGEVCKVHCKAQHLMSEILQELQK